MIRRSALRGLAPAQLGLAIGILDYLDRYPNAADTPQGIAGYWLEEDVDLVDVEDMLIELTERRLIARRWKQDGEWIYGRWTDAAPEAGAR